MLSMAVLSVSRLSRQVLRGSSVSARGNVCEFCVGAHSCSEDLLIASTLLAMLPPGILATDQSVTEGVADCIGSTSSDQGRPGAESARTCALICLLSGRRFFSIQLK